MIDLATGEHGDLFVLETATQDGLQGPGRLTRVGRDGVRTTIAERGLVSPTAVAIGPDGAAYVANCGIFPGGGPFPCTGHVSGSRASTRGSAPAAAGGRSHKRPLV